MTFVVREGDSTNTGGFVLKASGRQSYEERRLARMGDPVWCRACQRVGFIAQGNPTYIDDLVAVATNGQTVRCGCPRDRHRLVASQTQLMADMDATIGIPSDQAKVAQKIARKMNAAISEGSLTPERRGLPPP
jgi:uncharacterized Zn-binding protein involved in type VI secretion